MPTRRARRSAAAVTAVAALASFALVSGAQADDAARAADQPRLRGLTPTNQLVTIQMKGGGLNPIAITGLNPADTRIVGIDERPATGALYGLGSGGGVYTIDPATGVATFASQLSVALEGAEFGVDFNPVPDRLRIVSDTGQNLRVDVTTGVATVDLALNPVPGLGVGVTAAAYTNNDAAPETNTVLYDLNAATDQLAIQSPPNNGSLAAVGAAGVDVPAQAGMDIVTFRFGGAAAVSNVGYVVTGANLWQVNLETGKFALLRAFAPTSVIDIAVDVPAPAPPG